MAQGPHPKQGGAVRGVTNPGHQTAGNPHCRAHPCCSPRVFSSHLAVLEPFMPPHTSAHLSPRRTETSQGFIDGFMATREHF